MLRIYVRYTMFQNVKNILDKLKKYEKDADINLGRKRVHQNI